MKDLTINQMQVVEGGKELSSSCKLALVAMGLAYASLFCVTGVVAAALAIGSLSVSSIDLGLSCA